MTTFKGFSKQSLDFLKELAANNNRQWFLDNRHRYEKELRNPAINFVNELGAALAEIYPDIQYGTQKNGTGSIMRINRDIRFSKEKRPYKENLGLVFWLGEGKKVEVPGFYFHLGIDTAFFYGGWHLFTKEVMAQYREAVANDTTGTQLESIFRQLNEKELPLFEEPQYKKVPRGYPADHPRGELLKYAGMGVAKKLTQKDINSSKLVSHCAKWARTMKPLMDWLKLLQS